MVQTTDNPTTINTPPLTVKTEQPIIDAPQSQLSIRGGGGGGGGGSISSQLVGRGGGGGQSLEMGDTDVKMMAGVTPQSNAATAGAYGGPTTQGVVAQTIGPTPGSYQPTPSTNPTQHQPSKIGSSNLPPSTTILNGNAMTSLSSGVIPPNRPSISGPANSSSSTLQNQTPRPSINRGIMDNTTTRHVQPELFSRDYLERAQKRAAANVGVNAGESLIGIYADRSISIVLQDFARSLIRIKDHRLHTTYPPAPPYWTSRDDADDETPGVKRRPMWSLELVDEPYVTYSLLVAHQKQEEREDRRRRKQRMNELAARKASMAAAAATTTTSGSNENAIAGPSSHGTVLESPGDTTGGAPSPAVAVGADATLDDGKATATTTTTTTTKARPKTAEEKAAAKAQREAAKKAKDDAAALAASRRPDAGAKKKIKEPDVREANRSMGTHLAGVGKKRTFAWMPGADTPTFGGTLNAKLLGNAKKRKLGNEDGIAVPSLSASASAATPTSTSTSAAWKGKVGLSKLGAAKMETAEAPPAPTSTKAAGVRSVKSYLSMMDSVVGPTFPRVVDTVTLIDYKSALERYITRGGPTKQIFVREWERLLLKMAQEEQETGKRNAADVTAVYKVPPCHPGDEAAYAQKVREQEEKEEAAAAAAAATATTTAPAPPAGAGTGTGTTASTTASSGLQARPVVR